MIRQVCECPANPHLHGARASDPVVPYALGAVSKDTLLELGYAVEWHEYGMQHSVCQEELLDIEDWLIRQINNV